MQNIDFYSGKETRVVNNVAMLRDADNIARLDALYKKEAYKNKKRVSRLLSLIIALCIISFTTGLVMGIKFASGSNASLIDNTTAHLISGMRSKVAGAINSNVRTEKGAPKAVFPKEEYPYVIRLSKNFNSQESKEISQFLSKNGHTVIVSQKEKNYRLYVGPYKEQRDAESAIKLLQNYKKKNWFEKAEVIKR
ncbi:MAG: SPOR domain-containing protein [Spirochaetes bacterium]|nr:SPOR domain-containing protein [Spirochaetota bacterium]